MSRQRNSHGFSLLEIMAALLIVALIFGVAIPKLSRTMRVGLKSASRTLVGAIRYSFDNAALEQRMFRMVINFEDRTYWVESLDRRDSLYEEALESNENLKKNEKEKKEALPFKKLDDHFASTRQLPDGIIFKSFVTERTKAPIIEGKAFLYFFPHGYVEHALIHLQIEGAVKNENVYTLETSPLTGKVTVYHDFKEKISQ